MTNLPLLIVMGSQILFSLSDIMGEYFLNNRGFHLTTFLSGWFMAYLTLRMIATIGQLYVFSQFELGRTMALFGVAGLLFANVIGVLLFKQVLSLPAYIGIVLAVLAFMLIGLNRA